MNQKRDPNGVYPAPDAGLRVTIKKVRRYIPDDELTADLIRVSRALGKNTVSTREYDRLGSFNSSTLITRFGSWNKAIIEAGLMPVKNLRPRKERLLGNLVEVWQLLGRQPKLAEMTLRISRYSRGAYIKQFGSWLTVLEELERYMLNTSPDQYPLALRALPLNKGEKCYGEEDTFPSCFRRGTRGGTNRAPGIRLRMAVMKRDKFKCVLCGRTPANDERATLEMDHIIPWSKGGLTTIDNLQTLCSECNNGKSDLSP